MAPKKSTGNNASSQQLLKDAVKLIEQALGKKVQAVLVGNTVSARDHRILEAMDLEVKSWDALVEEVGADAGGDLNDKDDFLIEEVSLTIYNDILILSIFRRDSRIT